MQRPYDADTVRKRIHEFMALPSQEHVEPGLRGAIIGTLNKILASDGNREKADGKRHTILGWLFGDLDKPLKPMSTKELSDSQWFALSSWIRLERVVDQAGKISWLAKPEFMTEILYVLASALAKSRRDEQMMMVLAGLEEFDELKESPEPAEKEKS